MRFCVFVVLWSVSRRFAVCSFRYFSTGFVLVASVCVCVFVSLDCAAVGIGYRRFADMALRLPHPARMSMALDLSQSSDVLLCHADLQQCGASAAAAAAVAKNSRKILDITHALREDLPIWLGEDGLGRITAPVLSMSRGDDANVSELKLDSAHTGTHVDAPGHYVQELYEEGLDVALLDLNILVGKE